MQNIYEAKSANKRKSTIIVVLFFVFVGISFYFIFQAFNYYLGYGPGGLGLMGVALIFSGLLSFTSYYFSDRIVLGISKAREADRKRDFELYTVTENLALGAGLPKPKIFIIEDSATNAFATGRDPEHAVVCATRGLVDKLSRTELEGVIAHELSHIKNYDIRLMSVVAVLVGSIALLGDLFLRARFVGGGRGKSEGKAGAIFMLIGLVFVILSPVVANLIKLAISRRREFLADTGSVAITRQPQGLIDALKKITHDQEPLEAANKATAHLYITNPFKGKKDKRAVSKMASLFNTHPPIKDRIKALENMR